MDSKNIKSFFIECQNMSQILVSFLKYLHNHELVWITFLRRLFSTNPFIWERKTKIIVRTSFRWMVSPIKRCWTTMKRQKLNKRTYRVFQGFRVSGIKGLFLHRDFSRKSGPCLKVETKMVCLGHKFDNLNISSPSDLTRPPLNCYLTPLVAECHEALILYEQFINNSDAKAITEQAVRSIEQKTQNQNFTKTELTVISTVNQLELLHK